MVSEQDNIKIHNNNLMKREDLRVYESVGPPVPSRPSDKRRYLPYPVKFSSAGKSNIEGIRINH